MLGLYFGCPSPRALNWKDQVKNGALQAADRLNRASSERNTSIAGYRWEVTVRDRDLRGLSLGLTACVFAAAIAILNIGTTVSAQECPSRGGGRPSPSPSPSPTEDDEPLPIPPIPPEEEESPSPSPSPDGGGGGGAAKCDSEITIAYKKNKFKGKVTSDNNSRCRKGRTVKVKQKGKKGSVGRSRTNRKGKWKVRDRNADGRYFAKVTKRRVGNIVCKAAKSRTIRV